MEFTQLSCEEFTRILAGKEPVPGGGGASALAGALGVALGNMVGSLTVGKKKYAAVEDEIRALMERCGHLRACLIGLIQKDADAFEPLSRAYGMPKDTEAQRQKRAVVMEEALKNAAAVPLEIMEKCTQAIDIAGEFASKGTLIAISDAGCAAVLCGAALEAASLNVFVNTKLMKDREYAKNMDKKAKRMLEEYSPRAAGIFEGVRKSLTSPKKA